MVSLLSKVILSLGIVLIIAALGSIYITTIAQTQSQSSGKSSGGSSTTATPTSTQSPTGQGNGNGSSNNSQSSSGSNSQSLQGNTIIIPKGAQTQGSGNYYNPMNAKVKPTAKLHSKTKIA